MNKGDGFKSILQNFHELAESKLLVILLFMDSKPLIFSRTAVLEQTVAHFSHCWHQEVP